MVCERKCHWLTTIDCDDNDVNDNDSNDNDNDDNNVYVIDFVQLS